MDILQTSATLETLLHPVVEDMGYELVDLQLRSETGRWVLRLLVDRPGGITLDECARLSREVSPHLEVADLLPFRYVLEVSSPGIKRPLKRPAEFARFAGERVEVFTTEPIEGRKTFRGTNRGLDEEGNLLLDAEPGDRRVAIPMASLRRANLDPELKF
jgi:ribosome maturation factor RimP